MSPKSKRGTAAKVVMICVLITAMVAGCQRIAAPTQLADLKALVNKDILFAGASEGRAVLIDPADTQKTYASSTADAALFSELRPFTEVTLGSPDGGGPLYISQYTPAYQRNVPVVSAANDKEAAKLYPPALMDYLQWTCLEDLAIEAYTIKSTKLASTGQNAVTVEFVADLKPVSDPFAQANSRWGSPGADGWARDRKLTVTLYRYAGKYCAYLPDWRAVFTAGAPAVDQSRPTQYKPVVYENVWEALAEGKAVERVFHEDATYSYVTTTELQSSGFQFEMVIERIERATGARVALTGKLDDCESARALGINGDTLYVQLGMAVPNSEAFRGPVAALDLKAGGLNQLLPVQTDILGKAGSTVYIAALYSPDSDTPSSIQALDTATGELKRVSDIPGQWYGTSYDHACVMHVAAGKLAVLWPDPSDGDFRYSLYSIDPATGAIAKQ